MQPTVKHFICIINRVLQLKQMFSLSLPEELNWLKVPLCIQSCFIRAFIIIISNSKKRIGLFG